MSKDFDCLFLLNTRYDLGLGGSRAESSLTDKSMLQTPRLSRNILSYARTHIHNQLCSGLTGRQDDQETMCIMPIGAGNEVGRSCVILKFMGKTIMLDCGIHPVSGRVVCSKFESFFAYLGILRIATVLLFCAFLLWFLFL